MNKRILVLLIGALAMPQFSHAEGLLKYNPPKTGAPLTLTGGGTRGLALGVKPLQALAPKQLALTGQAQPILYWYAALPKPQTVEFTIIREGASQPLLEKQINITVAEGLQSIRLADYGVSLKPNEEYIWSVAVANAGTNSEDAVSGSSAAVIRYELPATPLSTVKQQAEAGYWYDALQQLIESHSAQANELLNQIGIQVPAL